MNTKQLKGIMEEFIRYLQVEKGAMANTKRAYKSDIKGFIKFIEKSGYHEIDHHTIRSYIVSIYKDIKKSSLSRKISSIKVFFRFLKKKGYIVDNTALIIKNPKAEKHLPKFYTIDEMFRFLDYLPTEKWNHLRNKAIFELMYSTGIRSQEALDINVEDIHIQGMWIRVKGKGGKERVLPFGEKAKKALESYIEWLKANKLYSPERPLFVNFKGERLSYRSLLRIMKKYQLKTGLFKNLTLHSIRHSFATHMLDSGADLRSIQELLGHSRLSTTQKYTHVFMDKLMETYDKSHPRR
ncbi:MAG TPA: tyrosine-type recombinase/integrase [Syntrophorhabdaceae bacterium]|nr:tyrosine-type recombinase/integrase [Syntrophorhabdaceae bacterium]